MVGVLADLIGADVRRAINHAIDRRSLVDTILFGLATVNSQNFPEGYFAFDEATGTDPFPYDQELARELLASAGTVARPLVVSSSFFFTHSSSSLFFTILHYSSLFLRDFATSREP